MLKVRLKVEEHKGNTQEVIEIWYDGKLIDIHHATDEKDSSWFVRMIENSYDLGISAGSIKVCDDILEHVNKRRGKSNV